VKPAAFEYFAPGSLDEALDLLAEHGADARPLAGGQSLVPAMNLRLARPAVLVDLNGLEDLAFIEVPAEGGLRVGAMTRQRSVETDARVAAACPLLHQAITWIGHPQIRNRGTIGGSLAHADPAAELPAVAIATEATVVARGPEGERRIAATDFFEGLMSTALRPQELLIAIEIPASEESSGVGFTEFCRRHGDYALVGAAARVQLRPDGTVAGARIVLLSVSDGPFLATDAADCLRNEPPTPAAIEAAAEAARVAVDPPGDIHASARYRRHLAGVMTRRALGAAIANAMTSNGTA
jgi:carbon-monoxide dehydrogenase medium subunit